VGYLQVQIAPLAATVVGWSTEATASQINLIFI
jgi:hypothetical protein